MGVMYPQTPPATQPRDLKGPQPSPPPPPKVYPPGTMPTVYRKPGKRMNCKR